MSLLELLVSFDDVDIFVNRERTLLYFLLRQGSKRMNLFCTEKKFTIKESERIGLCNHFHFLLRNCSILPQNVKISETNIVVENF